jgi:maleate isomerase
MTDSLGYRQKFGVIAPSTNTSVQPEFDAMAPTGVTNHMSRIFVRDDPVLNDDDFNKLVADIAEQQDDAIDRVMTCKPDHLVMGISAETFWGGLDASNKLYDQVKERAGVDVTMGSEATTAALNAYGGIKRIGVVTPYMEIGDQNVVRFFTDCGFEVAALKGLKCKSPVLIAQTTQDELRDAIMEVNSADVDAIIQVGTNLSMAKLAAVAETWLQKPVIAINTATYWRALRQVGIEDKIEGWGSLLTKY